MSGPILRPVSPADAPGLLELVAEVYGEYGLVLDAQGEEPHLLDPGAYFRKGGGEFWVVHGDERAPVSVVASVGVLLHEESGELKTLYVQPSCRRRGWGRALVERVIDYARQAGRPRLILWSDTRFLDAHRLYESMGFARQGLRDLHDSNHSLEYGFHLEL